MFTAAVEPPASSGETSVQNLLRGIPVFTIVDRNGVPFNVVGEDAIISGYFFIEYNEAKRVLDLARSSAAKSINEAKREKQPGANTLINPWNEARISSVPLDFAVTIVTKSLTSSRNRGATVFQIAPSVSDIDDALQLTGKTDLAEGKVPLFYYENFAIPVNNSTETPVYFRKQDLEAAFRKEEGTNVPFPPTNVTELFSLLAAMVGPDATDDLKQLVLVPPPESLSQAKAVQKRKNNQPPFVVGERILVL